MILADLKQSGVVFDPADHTYTTPDGRVLPGVTRAIRREIFGETEDAPEWVYARGTEVHESVALSVQTAGAVTDGNAAPVDEWAKAAGVTFVASEFVVSDCEAWASAVDLVGGDGTLYDIKTNADGVETLYCRWQLSIYKRLFEAQTGVSVPRLVVLHVTGGQCNPVEVAPVPEPLVSAFLERVGEGRPYLGDMAVTAAHLEWLTREHEALSAAIDSAKEAALDVLTHASAKAYKTETLSISRTEAGVRKSFDSARFRTEHPDEYAAYLKETTTAAGVRVTLRKAKQD